MLLLNCFDINNAMNSHMVKTIAGDGTAGCNGDSQPSTIAQLYCPYRKYMLYIGDEINNRIRSVNIASGITTTLCWKWKSRFW